MQPGTGPLELTLAANARDEIVDDEEGVGLLCTIEVTATATGNAQGTLGLRDAVIRVFLGSDSPADSLTLSTPQVREGWRTGSLGAGEAAGSAWWTRTPGPYRGEFELRYLTSEEKPRSVTAEFQCGPEVSPGTPPAITSFDLSPTSGVEAGDSLTVRYRAASELGLFRTALLVSGVREDTLWFPERYETAVDRSVAVEVPLGSPAGGSMGVTVVVQDALWQGSVSGPLTTDLLVDETPPELTVNITGFSWEGMNLTGQFGIGDSIAFRFHASDNSTLSLVGYDLGPPADVRDSAAAPAREWTGWFTHTVPAEWEGSPILTFFARDASGLETVLTSEPDSIRFYPVREGATRSSTVDGRFQEWIHDPARNRLYSGLLESAELVSIDLATLSAVHSVTLPERATDVELTLSGDTLLALLREGRALVVIELTADPWRIDTVAITVADTSRGDYALDVAVPAHGRALVLLERHSEPWYKVADIDLGTGEQRLLPDPEGPWLEADVVTRTPDRSRVVYASNGDGCTRVYDAATETFSDCRYLHCCGPLRTDRSGSHFLRELHLYDENLQYVRTLGELGEGSRSVLTPDGATALVTTEPGVQRIETATGFVLDRISGIGTGGNLLLAADGSFLLQPYMSTCCTELTILELP